MHVLEQILELNRQFVADKEAGRLRPVQTEAVSKYPERKLGVLTCMDTRLVDFLEPALGIRRGEAKIIKNAGNTVTHPFDGIIRSFMVAVYELGVEELLVVGHDDCGMVHTTADSLIIHMKARGVTDEAIEAIRPALTEWADYFHHPEENVRHTVTLLKTNPYLPKDLPVHGLIIDPHTGKLRVLVNGYESGETLCR